MEPADEELNVYNLRICAGGWWMMPSTNSVLAVTSSNNKVWGEPGARRRAIALNGVRPGSSTVVVDFEHADAEPMTLHVDVVHCK